uniref:Uncharacterized protein n=1 Tax=Pyxicephalus adspersus TaxID=30357 RepID=A0AAV3BB15_PYXAD|nr:TPA: hypothetical protein GDO54_001141 [Pyxicephalus adspersus]
MTKGNKEKLAERVTQKENIIRAVCALLNSGGGIVLVKSANKDYNYNQDGVGLDIETVLSDLLSCSLPINYCDFSQHGSFLLIFVKTWSIQKGLPNICSVNTGLYIRSFTSKKMANCMQVLELAEKQLERILRKGKKARRSSTTDWQSDLSKHLLDKPNLCLGEDLKLSESKHLEFKDYSTEKLEGRMKEIIKSYFSAFGNSDGGYLIIGVDNNCRITGCGKHCSKNELETFMEKEISNVNIFHFDNCDSQEPFHKITIKDVKDGDQKDSGYVIVLEVKPVCCLAFVNDPQCWKFDPDLKVEKRLSASEWIKIMTDKCSEPSLETQFERLEIGDRPPMAEKVYRKKGLENLKELQDGIFGSLEEEITIKPDNLYCELKEEYPELEGLLKILVADSEGVIILSRSWAVDLEENSNPNVVCDALLLLSGKHPKLYSVVKGNISESEFEYSVGIARTLKRQLVNIGGYTGKLCVIPAVLQLNSEIQGPNFSWPDITYPDTYKLDGFEDVKKLLEPLLIVMVSFKSYLGYKIGTEYLNLLTTEQYKLLSTTYDGIRGPFFVHGPPGTGKTVVALKIIQKIKNKFSCSFDQILFICENRPLKKYVSDQGICLTATRKAFEINDFRNVEHIVADEAQNFQCENGNWFDKAKQIVERDGRRGVFYVFLDYFQTCHNKNTGLPPWDQQNMHTLTKVVRSPEKIYKYMHMTMKKISEKKHGSHFMKMIMENIECCHGEYLSRSYPEGDIAILCNTEDTVNKYKPLLEAEMKRQTRKLRRRIKPFENAEDLMKDAIVLDTVRRFSGLERPIIFAINPVCLDPRVDDNVSLCAASRATARVFLYYEH